MINMSLTEANFSGEKANMAEDVIVIPISKNFESISGKVLAKNTHEEAIGIWGSPLISHYMAELIGVLQYLSRLWLTVFANRTMSALIK